MFKLSKPSTGRACLTKAKGLLLAALLLGQASVPSSALAQATFTTFPAATTYIITDNSPESWTLRMTFPFNEPHAWLEAAAISVAHSPDPLYVRVGWTNFGLNPIHLNVNFVQVHPVPPHPRGFYQLVGAAGISVGGPTPIPYTFGNAKTIANFANDAAVTVTRANSNPDSPITVEIAFSNGTPSGTEVTIQAADPATGTSATLTFENVTTAGDSVLTVIDGTQALPLGFTPMAGTTPFFFDLTTTAILLPNSSIEISINYGGLAGVVETGLRLYHFNGTIWEDATHPDVVPNPNTVSKILYGKVTSLSPFALVSVKTPSEQVSELITTVKGLPVAKATQNSLCAKLRSAACGPVQAFINEVNAQRGQQLTEAQATLLIANATSIRATLGCK